MNKESRHHVLWNRRDYATQKEKCLRSHQGMIALIPNELHFEKYPDSVHALVEAPPKPELAFIIGGLALLDSKPHSFLQYAENVIAMMADYFGGNGEEAVGNNLYRQLEVIGRHIV